MERSAGLSVLPVQATHWYQGIGQHHRV